MPTNVNTLLNVTEQRCCGLFSAGCSRNKETSGNIERELNGEALCKNSECSENLLAYDRYSDIVRSSQ
jgi:hypothetical protein